MSRSLMIKGVSAILLWSLLTLFLVFLQARPADAMPAQAVSSQSAATVSHHQATARMADASSMCPVNIGYGTTPISEEGKPTITINGGTTMTLEIEMDTGQGPCTMKVKFTGSTVSDDIDTKGGVSSDFGAGETS